LIIRAFLSLIRADIEKGGYEDATGAQMKKAHQAILGSGNSGGDGAAAGARRGPISTPAASASSTATAAPASATPFTPQVAAAPRVARASARRGKNW